MKIRLSLLLVFVLSGWPVTAAPARFIDWANLRNPVLAYPHWSIKDAAIAYRDGVFYIFFSAFYEDRGRVRSHVAEVSTHNFKTYSSPILDFDGERAGWIGMCSPDVQKLGGIWELSFNSWGDDPKRPDQLFFMTSRDLVHWSPRRPLAANLTKGQGVIDLSVARTSNGYYAIWKQGRNPRLMRPRLAAAAGLDGPWHLVGSGDVTLNMADGKENGLIHENFEFIWIDGILHLLSSDYPHGHHEYLYTLLNVARPLAWGKGFELNVPSQSFNHMIPCDAAALYDWRKHDGYFYLIYAGRNEQTTYLHRGWNRLALSRSKDLVHWDPAGWQK
ncbi:MAG TPA: hypothetical protein VGX94_09420 [Terriglobia bacterium]|nr:hypothetical protein [Terriglobia bacterium]